MDVWSGITLCFPGRYHRSAEKSLAESDFLHGEYPVIQHVFWTSKRVGNELSSEPASERLTNLTWNYNIMARLIFFN